MPTWRSSRTTSPTGGGARCSSTSDVRPRRSTGECSPRGQPRPHLRSADEDQRSPTSIGTSRHSARSTASWPPTSTTRGRERRGGLLADVGRIDEAVELLEPLVRDELANAFAAGALGYCYRKLERWPEAVALLQTAVDLDAGVAWYQQELDGRSTAPAAPPTPRRCTGGVLSTVDDGMWADRNSLIVAGWCAFRLNRLTWAAALLGARRQGTGSCPRRADLGLVLLASGRPRVALDEYNGAIDLLRKHADEARARAMLISARDDLLQARQEGRLDAHRDAAEHIDAMLREEISRYAVPA